MRNDLIYRVEKGETINSVCKKFGVDKQSFLKLNDHLSDNLREGMRVHISNLKGEKYIVKPFETVHSLAKKFSVSEDYIRENNDLKEVFVGLIVYI